MKSKTIATILFAAAVVALLVVFARPLIAWFTLQPMDARAGAESSIRAGNLAFKVALEPDPPRQQGNALLITVDGPDGKPVDDADVQLAYVMPAMGAMPEMRGAADVRSDGKGHYRASFDLPMGGTWTLELTAASPKGSATARYNITVGNRGLVPVGTEAHAAPAAPARLSDDMVKRIRAVFAAYEEERAALATDRLDLAQSKARSLAAALRDAGDPADKGLMNCVQATGADADQLAAATTIENARGSFATISRLIVTLAASDPRLSKGLHLFTCPMTKGFNQWMQPAAAASNPYLGTSMPDCGTPTDWTKVLAAQMKVGEAPGGIAYYTCSMHPNVRHVDPGKCPICSMNLVPVSEKDAETGVFRVPEVRRQEIGVTTAIAEIKPLRLTIRAVGKTAYDETRVRDVTLKLKGWIEKLYVNETGQYVRRGQPLLALYSPDLYAAEQEYLLALNSQAAAKTTGAPDRADYLVRAARERLKLLDLTDGQIDRIAATGKAMDRMPILSPYNGFVIEKDVFEGGAVQAGQRLYRIADLDRIWIEADVYESDLPQLAVGQPVRVTFPYMPGTKYDGRIAYVYPYLNPQTRTGKVRIDLPNPHLALKPEMYADVTLEIDRGPRLVIPVSAVVQTGPRNVVFLDLGDGRLRPQDVQLGLRNGDDFEVLSGVQKGDKVVASANFLISAESRIRSAESFWGGEQ